MLNGILIATKDMNEVVSLVGYGAKAIYMGDPMSAPTNVNFIKPAILIPDYNMMSLYIDGRMKDFQNAYLRVLNSPKAHEAFATIIGALFLGNNVVMYFPPEVDDIGYSEILLRNLEDVYGVRAQTKSTRFFYDESKHQFNLRLLFLYNIINAETYVMNAEVLDDLIIDKIRKEIPPTWEMPMDVANAQFVKILEQKKEQVLQYGKVLPNMVTKIKREG